MGGRVIYKSNVERRPGYLYFIDKHGNICEVKMARGGRKAKAGPKIIEKAGIKRKGGFLYYLDKKCNACEVKMNRKGGKKKPKSKLAKPTEKYLVYESTNAADKTVYKAKKILLAAKVRGMKVGRPGMVKGTYGVTLTYESKPGSFYQKSSKFVSLQKPARNVRVVNEVPKKYK